MIEKNKYGSGRARIMRAVTDVVHKDGLRGLTFRAVAESAGVANSLIVHHFGTRQRLLEETLFWTLSEAIGLSKLPTFLDDPESYVQALFDLLTADMAIVVFQYQMILESQRKPGIQESVRQLYQQYVDELIRAMKIRTSANVDEESGRFIFATLDGLVLQYVAGVERSRIEGSMLTFWKKMVQEFPVDQGAGSVLFSRYPELRRFQSGGSEL